MLDRSNTEGLLQAQNKREYSSIVATNVFSAESVRRKAWWLAPVVVLSAWALSWWPVLGGAHRLIARDLQVYAAPMKHYLRERLLAGELPLWNPWLGAGLPSLADPANQTLYPLNALILLAGDSASGLSGFILAHALLAPLAFLVLARSLRVGPGAALAGALLYGASGYVLSMLENVNYMAGAVWVPVLIAALRSAIEQRSVRRLTLAGLALSMLILAGDPLAAVAGLAAAT